MTLTRLFAAALVICSLPAFTQDQQSQSSLPATGRMTAEVTKDQPRPNLNRERFLFALNWPTAATPAEPWRIIPNRPADFRSEYNALDPARLDQHRIDQMKSDPQVSHLKVETLDADVTCYTIRAYVVARDSKDSDSTHPAGYSTCQPSSRYGLKTTEIRTQSAER